jgi:hypothetical protein
VLISSRPWPAPPVTGGQVDVQVRRVRRQLGQQPAVGVEHHVEEVLLLGHRRAGQRLVPGPQTRQPPFPVRGHEVGGAGRADHVADGAPATVQHVGVFGLQEQVRPGGDIGDQVIGAVPAAHPPARVRGLHTDLIHRGPVTVTVAADRSGQAPSLLSDKAR